jgi:bifunctional non-homologous end joining protein LigD
VQTDAGYLVSTSYGRRGGNLTDGTKTKAPVTLERARKIFEAVVKEKLTEDPPYHPDETGGVYIMPPADVTAEWLPQLLNVAEEADAPMYIADPAFGAQRKHNGQCGVVGLTPDGQPFAVNRQGAPVPLATEVDAALRRLYKRVGRVVMPAERMGRYVWCHGLFWLKQTDYRPQPYGIAYEVLQDVAPYFESALRLSQLAVTVAEKQALFDTLKAKRAEGMVLKRLSAPYAPGKPASGGDQLKIKFWSDPTSVVVLHPNDDRASFAVGLYDGARLIEMGNVTCPPNKTMPQAGAIVDIQYLYAHPGGAFYQPKFLQPRTDLVAADCHFSQVKYKADSEE